MVHPARLIYAVPAENADLFWACRFDVPDPCLFIEYRRKRHLILSDLELDRGRRSARVDVVLSYSGYAQRLVQQRQTVTPARVVAEFCRERRIRHLEVPANTPVALVDQLRAARLRVTSIPSPFFPGRLIKTTPELREIRRAQRLTFQAIALAETILRDSTIRQGKLFWQGRVLTSERMKAEIGAMLVRAGYVDVGGMIIAGGNDSTEPHNVGSGILRPHTAIIVDIFPRSTTSLYFGDATRTYCRGRADPELTRLYRTVKDTQEWALDTIRAGIDGQRIHRGIVQRFAQAGFPTKEVRGRKQGFIHGTGHGLGLALHEEPVRIAPVPYRLRAGHVVTVEPGLYYRGLGGVRIEDVVVVTTTGCELLARYPKRLEILD